MRKRGGRRTEDGSELAEDEGEEEGDDVRVALAHCAIEVRKHWTLVTGVQLTFAFFRGREEI